MPIHPEDKGRYPPNWKEISRRIRFERAGGQCEAIHDGERCQARHGCPHPVTGSIVVLTVAHLDHTPEHCDDENLRALCQRDHLAYDREHHAASRARRKLAKVEAERARIRDKSNQLAFEVECSRGGETLRLPGRSKSGP